VAVSGAHREQTDRRASDEERWRAWMVAAQAGDAVSYERLLHELLPAIRSYFSRRLDDRQGVEDLVQNFLLAVHRARHTYASGRPLRPWLYAVARHILADHYRSRARRLRRERGFAPGDPEPVAVERAGGVGSWIDLDRALAALPAVQRVAVTRLQLDGLSVAEAAKREGVSTSALKVRAHRGYRALRGLLGGAAS
jgi:RNA polymerase sigma-70 factor (ECF subfamily)